MRADRSRKVRIGGRCSLRDGIEQLVEKTKIFRSSFADWFSGGHLVGVVAEPDLVAYTIYQGKKLASPCSASREPKALPWADLLWPCRPEAKCARREGTEESSSLPLLILHFTNDMTPSRVLACHAIGRL